MSSRFNRAYPVAEPARAQSDQAFVRAGFRDPTLVLRWDEIAGPETARLARPLKLSSSAQGGVLTLKTEPGAGLFLQHESRTLIARINAFLGRSEVTRLRFVQSPLIRRPSPQPRTVSSAVPPPNDPAYGFRGPESVRVALLKLAAARRSGPRSD